MYSIHMLVFTNMSAHVHLRIHVPSPYQSLSVASLKCRMLLIWTATLAIESPTRIREHSTREGNYAPVVFNGGRHNDRVASGNKVELPCFRV
jgi:hypothetical protein